MRYSCSFSDTTSSFYRAFNSIFVKKVGRVVSEEVTVELMKKECLPVLYYATETSPLEKTDISSLDYAVRSCFSKIFCLKLREAIDDCMTLFGCVSVENVALNRQCKFLKKYLNSRNVIAC